MKVILKQVKTPQLIEFIKLFKGFSDMLFLEIGPNYFRSRVASEMGSRIRLASITFEDVVEEMSKEIEFRAIFYRLDKVISALKFENEVDLEFQINEQDGVYYAKKMKILGSKAKLDIYAAYLDVDNGFFSDELIENRILNLINPIYFDVMGDDISSAKKMAKFFGDETIGINSGDDGVKSIFSDGELLLNSSPQDKKMIYFKVEDFNELSNTCKIFRTTLGDNRIVFEEPDRDCTTIFARTNQ